jgi:hypothetical protein
MACLPQPLPKVNILACTRTEPGLWFANEKTRKITQGEEKLGLQPICHFKKKKTNLFYQKGFGEKETKNNLSSK